MTKITGKAKKLARELLRENRHGRSWRTIAKQDYGGTVSHATLNRFANNKGAWIPKDEKILYAMGLIDPCAPKPVRLPPWLEHTEEAIKWFTGQRQKVKELSKATRKGSKENWPHV